MTFVVVLTVHFDGCFDTNPNFVYPLSKLS